MEVNVRQPIGHMTEFIFDPKGLNMLNSLFNKLAIEVDNNKQLGFASKRRLNVMERDFFGDLKDRINASTDYVNKEIQIDG